MESQDKPRIRPIRDQVLVKQDPSRERVGREGLLFAPQGSEEWPQLATVLAVGPGLVTDHGVLVKLDVAPGDRVMFKRRPDTALVPDWREGDPNGWKDLLMLSETDIIGVITEESVGE